jgi:hypothetical protein
MSEPVELHQLFRADDRIDRFVFLIYETVADLGTMESRVKNNLYVEGTSIAQTLYPQRHLSARVEDSWRVVAAIRDHEDVAEFVAEAGARGEANWLMGKLTKPRGGGNNVKTPVQRLLQADRQRTIHLASVDDKAFRGTLESAADEVVQIGVYADRRIIEFPEAAITRAIFGDLSWETGRKALKERADLIECVLLKFRTMAEKCLDLQLRRRGHTLDQIFVDRR